MSERTPNLIPLGFIGHTLYTYPVWRFNDLHDPSRISTYTVTDPALREEIAAVCDKKKGQSYPHLVCTRTEDFVIDGITLKTSIHLREPEVLWIEHIRKTHIQ